MATFSQLSASDKKELWACLALRHAWGIGALRAMRLVGAYGSALAATEAALADPGVWARHGLLPSRTAGIFAGEGWRAKAREEWEGIQRSGCSFALWNDPHYPGLLRETGDAPLILYYKGDISLANGPAVGVVGSRNCTREGIAVAAFFARGLSKAGVTVVSGMAKGIDRAAHLAGLEGPGRSIAVLGTGIDIVYPPDNADLEKLMAAQGLILSEFAPGTQALPKHFPIRNRLISGLSRGVLVVEAAARSGSLITARLALEQGRDVFAVPGHTMAAVSEGCRELVRRGAKAVFSADDILEDLAELLSHEARRALHKRREEERKRRERPVPRNAADDRHEDALNTAETVLPEGALPWVAPESPRPVRERSRPWKAADSVHAGGKPPAEKNPESPEAEEPRPDERAVLEALGDDARHIDQLARDLGMEVARLSALLLVLEVSGRVTRLPGMLYRRAGGRKHAR